MYQLVRTTDEIDTQLHYAYEGVDAGGRFAGMTFEEGVQQAIEWMTDHGRGEPIPTDDGDADA